jgi:hypothetical protein
MEPPFPSTHRVTIQHKLIIRVMEKVRLTTEGGENTEAQTRAAEDVIPQNHLIEREESMTTTRTSSEELRATLEGKAVYAFLPEESTPLLVAESRPRGAQERSTSTITMPIFNAFVSGDSTSTNSKGWNNLKSHMNNGDLLLQLHSNCGRSSSNKEPIRSRSTLRRLAFEEFQEGMNFSVPQCLMAIVSYVAVSIVLFSFVLEPQWTIIDSCYFAVGTFTTLGT